MKRRLGAFAVAAALGLAGALASTPALAAPAGKAKAESGAQSPAAVSNTDMSAHRRHWRRHRIIRPWPHVYPYSYSYYRPRPHFYRPYFYNPYPVYYHRPYVRPYRWGGGPVFSIGFGPRPYW
jgi:hypothetical protein